MLENNGVGVENIIDVCADLEECLVQMNTSKYTGPGISSDSDLILLDSIVKEMLDIEARLKIEKEAIETMERMMSRDQLNPDDIVSWFKDRVATKTSEYEASDDKYSTEAYQEFRQRIIEIRDPNAQFNGDDDDELMVTSQVVSYKCPITQAIMTDPYTCRDCKHSFSSVVLEMMRSQPQGYACPIPGCYSVLHKGNVVKDPKLARAVARWTEMQDEMDV